MDEKSKEHLAKLIVVTLAKQIEGRLAEIFGAGVDFMLIVSQSNLETAFHITTFEHDEQLTVLRKIRELIENEQMSRTSLKEVVDEIKADRETH